MTIRRKVARELAKHAPEVPSIRSVARTLGAPASTVAQAYRALGVKSPGRAGRPPIFASPTIPVQFRIPTAIFDRYAHAAASNGRAIPVNHLIRAHVVAAAPRPKV